MVHDKDNHSNKEMPLSTSFVSDNIEDERSKNKPCQLLNLEYFKPRKYGLSSGKPQNRPNN